MADINLTSSKRDNRRPPIKVDLTAMVDLGFLLITFFMLASSLYKPKVLEILKPSRDKPIDPPQVKDTKSLVCILGRNDMLYKFSPVDIQSGNFLIDSMKISNANLRKLFLNKKRQIVQEHGEWAKDDLVVIIKPLSDSHLNNIVDIIDEMLICGIKKYAIVRPDDIADLKVLNHISHKN